MMPLEHLHWRFSCLRSTTTCIVLLCLVLAAIIVCLRWTRINTLRAQASQRYKPSTQNGYPSTSDKTTQIECGDWKPVEFVYPNFPPCDTKLEDKQPLPYRPFRWGAYHITMGIRNMDWADWIEIDNLLPRYHAIRTERLRNRGDKVVKVLPSSPGIPGAGSAAQDCVYELAEFLTRRYPETYSVVRHPTQSGDFGWYGEGQIKKITIEPLNVSYDLDHEDPMTVAALLTQDDIAIMIEGSDGRYYFQGGAILVPGFWRMEDKLGMPLEDIHTSGLVPQYREKLQMSLGRFFSKLPVDKLVQRNNYFFQVVRPENDAIRKSSTDPDELAWSDTTNGDEDLFEQTTKEPSEEAKGVHGTPKVVDSVENIRLRSERQTLRRLPRTGAIIFTIRTYIFSIVDLSKEPGVPGRMASAIRSWSEDVARYKGQRLYRDAILPYLDEKHDEQVRTGKVSEGDRKSNYPF